MLRLKRLKIDKYRNVRPGCELHFNDGFNVPLGQNGTGKTTLLNLISAIFRLPVPEIAKGELSLELELEFSGGRAIARISSVPGGQDSYRTDAELVVHLDGTTAPILLFLEGDIWTQTPGKVFGGTAGKNSPIPHILYLLLMGKDVSNATRIGQVSLYAHRLDESLELFHSITSKNVLYSIQNIPMLQNPRLVVPAASTVVPGAVEKQLIEAFFANPDSTDLSFSDTDLPFLGEIVNLLGFRTAQLKVELLSKTVKEKTSLSTYGNFRFSFTRRDGSIILHDFLSYGQKRLLTCLWYLAANPDVFIADELVNGLHHSWIEEIVKAIGTRQAFLTSQNPLLLDYMSFESIEQVKSSFVLCRTEVTADREEMVWSNMTDDEADMFFRAYKTGVQYVGEILKTRGLW